MVYASNFPYLMQDSQGYGWQVGESTNLDWQKMISVVNKEVERLNGVYQRMLDKSNVKLYEGYARFLDPHTVEIGEQKVTADKILIAVGGHPVKPGFPGSNLAITSDDMFHLKEQPQRIAIIGGGYIGVEFSCIMNRLGSEVTLIHRHDRILRGFDQSIREEVETAMQNHGIRVYCDSEAEKIEETSEGLKVTVEGTYNETVTVDAVLAATGRRPNLKNLGLENAGVELDCYNIAVNRHSQTSQEHIYAVGDCANYLNLTPVAINEGRAFADTVFGGKDKVMVYQNVPTAVFSTPEAATVGMTESEAREKYGEAIKIYRTRFRPTYYTLAGRDEKTMMKLVVHNETDKILGVHMVGDSAAEIIQSVAIAVKMGATKADFDATVGVHPTIAEELVTMR
jgi:glutathione reductase (NADPH)